MPIRRTTWTAVARRKCLVWRLLTLETLYQHPPRQGRARRYRRASVDPPRRCVATRRGTAGGSLRDPPHLVAPVQSGQDHRRASTYRGVLGAACESTRERGGFVLVMGTKLPPRSVPVFHFGCRTSKLVPIFEALDGLATRRYSRILLSIYPPPSPSISCSTNSNGSGVTRGLMPKG